METIIVGILVGSIVILGCWRIIKQFKDSKEVKELFYKTIYTEDSTNFLPKYDVIAGKIKYIDGEFIDQRTRKVINPGKYDRFFKVQGDQFKDLDIKTGDLLFGNSVTDITNITVPNFVVIMKDNGWFLRKVVKVNKKSITIEPIGNEGKLIMSNKVNCVINYDFKMQ